MLPDAARTAHRAQAFFYVWEVPGAEAVIHLSLDAVERLNAAILQSMTATSERLPEIGGILLGAIEPGERPVIVIEDFQFVNCEYGRGASWTLSPKDRVKLNERLARRQWPAPLVAVGCFRTHTRPGLYLDQDDFVVFSQYFSDPRQAFLLVRPASGTAPTAGFFIWEEGDVQRQSTRLAFPFDAAQLQSGAHPVARRPAAPSLLPAPSTARPAPVPLPAGWRLPAAAAAVLLAAAALYQWIAPRLARPGRPAPHAIALRVERTGAALRLFWDRESPAVRKARAGIVNISEGTRRLRIDLTAQQLASGSVTYFPSGPDIAFDMELRGPALTVSESVRAVVPAADLPPALDARLFEPSLEPPAPAPRRATASRAARRAPAHRPFAFERPAPPPAAEPALEPPPALAAAALTRHPAAPPFLAPRLRNVTVTCEPAAPSRFSRIIRRIPLVRSLQDPRSGKDYVPPAPLREIKPVVPAGLSLGDSQEPVELKVHIDEAGRVLRTELLSQGSFAARLAVGAATQWRFAPARLDGMPVSSEMLLQFKFEP